MKILVGVLNIDTSVVQTLNSRLGLHYGYWNSPGEALGRFGGARLALSRAHIYDPCHEDFTRKHLRELLKSDKVIHEKSIADLLGGYYREGPDRPPMLKKKRHLIWALNNFL